MPQLSVFSADFGWSHKMGSGMRLGRDGPGFGVAATGWASEVATGVLGASDVNVGEPGARERSTVRRSQSERFIPAALAARSMRSKRATGHVVSTFLPSITT